MVVRTEEQRQGQGQEGERGGSPRGGGLSGGGGQRGQQWLRSAGRGVGLLLLGGRAPALRAQGAPQGPAVRVAAVGRAVVGLAQLLARLLDVGIWKAHSQPLLHLRSISTRTTQAGDNTSNF